MLQAYRRLREYLRRRWVNAYPDRFRWTPRLIKFFYRLPLPAALSGRIRILEKLLVPDRLYETIYLEPEHIRMRLRLGDAIQAQIYYWGHSEPHLIDWFRNQVKPHSIVLDVGAHCGQYALTASRVQVGVNVYAFEPDAENVNDLRHNLRINHIDNVDVRQVAVSDQTGRMPLYTDHEHFGFANHSLARGAKVFRGEAHEVDVVTLDGVILAKNLPVCLIKLDIEGAELLALQGSEAILRRDQPALLLEVERRWLKNYGHDPSNLQNYLHSLGYSCYWIDQQGQHHRIGSDLMNVGSNWIALTEKILGRDEESNNSLR